jgi:translation initiation factor IF-2
MEGLLAPTYKEQDLGVAEVREVFKVPKIGVVAGCSVIEGKVRRNCVVHVIREGIEIFSGKISSLKRFKDDVKEVETGYECGIGIDGLQDLKAGDLLEFQRPSRSFASCPTPPWSREGRPRRRSRECPNSGREGWRNSSKGRYPLSFSPAR